MYAIYGNIYHQWVIYIYIYVYICNKFPVISRGPHWYSAPELMLRLLRCTMWPQEKRNNHPKSTVFLDVCHINHTFRYFMFYTLNQFQDLHAASGNIPPSPWFYHFFPMEISSLPPWFPAQFVPPVTCHISTRASLSTLTLPSSLTSLAISTPRCVSLPALKGKGEVPGLVHSGTLGFAWKDIIPNSLKMKWVPMEKHSYSMLFTFHIILCIQTFIYAQPKHANGDAIPKLLLCGIGIQTRSGSRGLFVQGFGAVCPKIGQ